MNYADEATNQTASLISIPLDRLEELAAIYDRIYPQFGDAGAHGKKESGGDTVNNHATHVLRHYKSKNATQLYRRANKMIVAAREGVRVAWGEDPKAQQGRAFIDEDAALRFMRNIAAMDQHARKGIVCKDCGYAPAEMIVCDANNDGAHRIDHDSIARIEEEDAGRAALVQ